MERIDIDPQKMMLVTIKEMSGEEVKYAAIACAYIPVVISGSQERGIAVEVVVDPEISAPSSIYSCPMERLSGIVLSPNRLVRVSPYIPSTGELIS